MTITERAAQYATERGASLSGMVALQRAYMAGALDALTSKATRDQLLAECVQFGRAIGTAAERATT